MKTFYKTTNDALIASRELMNENPNSYIIQGSTQCDCGESVAFFTEDDVNNKCLGIFIDCEACYNEYE